MPDSNALPEAEQKVFRWLNYGSCLMRSAFDTPDFYKQAYQGLPLQVSRVWRREISALISDWEVVDRHGIDLPPSQFSEAWVSSRKIFQDADAVLVDLVLDVFQDQCLRFRRDEDDDLVPYRRVITNFPEEVPPMQDTEVGVFPCDIAGSLRAWERFGEEVKSPTVFVTLEHRDDIKPGYHEEYRRKLLDYQSAVERLASKFPHWLVIDMDEVFADIGPDCYLDRHHPTDLGWKVLRERVPQIMAEKGVLKPDSGGMPLPMGTKYIPERCDFGVVDLNYISQLSRLGLESCAVGPERLTDTVKSAFTSGDLATYASFSALKNQQKPELIIAMKWDQPARLPAWITGLMKQHPDALIELPCLWKNREKNMLSPEEAGLRRELLTFSRAHLDKSIDMSAVPPARINYVARCLLRSHRRQAGSTLFQSVRQAEPAVQTVRLPETLVAQLSSLELVPVFGVHC